MFIRDHVLRGNNLVWRIFSVRQICSLHKFIQGCSLTQSFALSVSKLPDDSLLAKESWHTFARLLCFLEGNLLLKGISECEKRERGDEEEKWRAWHPDRVEGEWFGRHNGFVDGARELSLVGPLLTLDWSWFGKPAHLIRLHSTRNETE